MAEPLRIAQVLGCVTGYGVENGVMNYYRAIDRSKVQFDFIVHDDSTRVPGDEIEALGGRVFIVPSYRRLHAYMRALGNIFRQNQYRIVHSNISTMNVFPLCAAKRAGVPIRIAHNHTTAAKGEGAKNAMKYMLRPFARCYATHCAACSEHAGAWLYGKRAVRRGDVTIIRSGVRLKDYAYDAGVRARVRQELGLGDCFVVGHTGRLCHQKNQDFLIDIFRCICAQRPDSRLMLVGDGDKRAELEAKAESLGLKERVIFTGMREDVSGLYQAMDAFAFPSRYEGLGLSVIEAQLAGLKVVASTEVPQLTKVRDDMSFMELSAGPEWWAQEILRADTANRSCTGDFSLFDIELHARWLERYYEALNGAADALCSGQAPSE